MKLRTAIVEDQKPDAERLEQLLKKAFGEEEILCRRFVCGDDFLKEFPGEGYQVVFLDICMEGTNGIETARQLRAADPELLIVFVTSSPEYVWDAFPVHPFDYLLKPYKIFFLFSVHFFLSFRPSPKNISVSGASVPPRGLPRLFCQKIRHTGSAGSPIL